MKAALLLDLGRPLEIEDVELRPPGPREAIVRTLASAVCITDVFSGEGRVMAKPPSLLGHAAAGIVEEVGTHVSRVRPGDRVVVCGTPECGLCYWCTRGQPAFCEELPAGLERQIATRRDGQPVYADGGIGTFAERLNVREAGLVSVEAEMPDSICACSAAAR